MPYEYDNEGNPTGGGYYEWVPDLVWVSAGHYEYNYYSVCDTAWDGFYGSSYQTDQGDFKVDYLGGRGEVQSASSSRGLIIPGYQVGDMFAFRAVVFSPLDMANSFRVKPFDPNGSLVASNDFNTDTEDGVGGTWRQGYSTCYARVPLSQRGIWRVELQYFGTGLPNPTNGSVSYYIAVGGAVQTINLPAISAHGFADPEFVVPATASSGLPVTLAVSGPAVISDKKLRLTGTGTVTVTATQAGNATYLPAIPKSVQFTAGPVSIIEQPMRTLSDVGVATTFAVKAVGLSPLTYQWRKNGVNVAGATSPTFTIPSTQTSNAGSYSVAVTGGVTVASNEVPLTVGGPVAVMGQTGFAPGTTMTISTSIYYGSSVNALGWRVVLPPGWSYSGPVGGGSLATVRPIAGATGTLEWNWLDPEPSPLSFSYTVNVPWSASGSFTIPADGVISRNGTQTRIVGWPLAAGSGTVAAGIISEAPSASEQIVQTAHSADLDKNFCIALNDLNRVIELYNTRSGTVRTGRYLVQEGTPDGFNPDTTTPSGATLPLLKYHSADSNKDGTLSLTELTRVIELYNYRVGTRRTGEYYVLENTEDGFHSGPGPSAPPRFESQPRSVTVTGTGAAVAFDVLVYGTLPVSYQWRKAGNIIAGATFANFSLPNVQYGDAGSYDVLVSNVNGSVVSTTATLTVNVPAPVITSAASATMTIGSSFSYAITATNSPTSFGASSLPGGLSVNSANGQISGTPTAIGTTTSTISATNATGTGTATLSLTVNGIAPTITAQPVNAVATAGGSASFSVTATGNPAPTYQWRKGGLAISGASNASLVLSNVQTTSAGSYDVVVSNSAGVATSVPVILTVNSPPFITSSASTKFTAGLPGSFTVTATGTPAPTLSASGLPSWLTRIFHEP